MPILQAKQNFSKIYCFPKTVVELIQEPLRHPSASRHFSLLTWANVAGHGSSRLPLIFECLITLHNVPMRGKKAPKPINIVGNVFFLLWNFQLFCLPTSWLFPGLECGEAQHLSWLEVWPGRHLTSSMPRVWRPNKMTYVKMLCQPEMFFKYIFTNWVVNVSFL